MSTEPTSPDYRPPPAEDSNRQLTRVGKYEILSHIATGGMGAVYRARDTELGREVALKILPPELAARPGILERFRREARHAAKLRHENAVTLFECGEVDGTNFLAMELVEGTDLQDFITRRGRLDPETARQVLLQAARALDHAHREGLVHRDIKPANFLITERNGGLLVKLTDLGLALEASEDEFRLTKAGCTVGSVDYMAPEQARDSRAVDIRSDIYSLGCTLYHMLAGEPPFAEGSLTERVFKHIEAEVPDVRRVNPEVPPSLVYLLQRMLAKQPADRYQNPADLIADLERLSSPPAAPSRPSAPKKRVQQVKKKRVPVEESPTDHEVRHTTRPTPAPGDVPAQAVPTGASRQQQRAAAGQFERARQVLAEGNTDYGLQWLRSCCLLDPGEVRYRQALRLLEKEKYGRNGHGSPFAWLTTLLPRLRLKAAARAKNHLRVLVLGEDILAHNPWDLGAQLAMAQAADALGMQPLALWLLEEAREKDAEEVSVNRQLALLYEKQGRLSDAIALWELVRKVDPTDREASRKAKDLAANDTIRRAGYDGRRGQRRPPRPERRRDRSPLE